MDDAALDDNDPGIIMIVFIFVVGMSLMTAVAILCCTPSVHAFFHRWQGPVDVSKVFVNGGKKKGNRK